ncbi:MAG: copper amine oxidase N-terminal domain-containing protein [Oscillospiraceae bacterium]|nr:copper amine oxidase N-terminal domain-containing protein [Oscillospiraceae bacterium]
MDGAASEMDVPAQILNGRTLLPIRFVSEAFGCSIDWIGTARQAVIVFVTAA